MNTAYIAYNMKDKNFYIIKKSTYDALQYRFKTKYVIIYDIEYDDSHELQNMKLEEKPYGLEKAKEIVDKILGENKMLTDNNHLDKETIKKTGSIYTPLDIVEKMMAKVEDEFWCDPTKTFCDPTCGTGAIIIPMLDNRVKHGIDPTVALKTMYGNELLKESYDILMKNLEEWALAHNVTDTSWKENFFNLDFFKFIELVDDPDKAPLECFFE